MSADKMGEGLRIVVDLPWDTSACMGTGAYSETMVRALAGAAPKASITLVASLGEARRIQLPNVSYAHLPTSEGLTEGVRQVALPAFLEAVRADCLFAPASLVPAVKACPTVATVLDLAFETNRDQYSPGLIEYMNRWFAPTLGSADRIVAISDAVRQDLVARKGVDPSRVVVIEPPIREVFRERLPGDDLRRELRRFGISGPYFFHVSNLAVHKNMEFGVRVFAEYLKRRPESPHRLLFAGGGYAPSAPPDLHGLARRLGIGDRVHYVGKVDDADLKALYQGCEAFLFPSLVEGWGLPVAEARTLGATVLASPHVPAARPSEKLPLDVSSWASRLEEEGSPSTPLLTSAPEDAGNQLLSVILDVCRYRPESDSTPAVRMNPEAPTVSIRADWYSPSGLGQAARGVYQALETAGVRPVASLVPKDAIQDKRLWRGGVTLRRDPADLWIHHVPPEYMDLSLPGRHAGFFFWETDRIPDQSAAALSRLDELWAPSSFVAEVAGWSVTGPPVVTVPPPIDTELFSPGARRVPPVELPAGFDPSWTVILYVGTWDPRKRPDTLVRSFSRAFSERDRALLLVKSYVTGDPAKDREILRSWVAGSREGTAHIRFIADILAPREMADLFRFATAFATASRGEGYCLPAVQAMSCGKPSVAVGWSAFSDYVSIPVGHTVRAVPPEVTLPGYSPDQHWAVVDEEDLARKLRWVHEHRDQVALLGRKAREWVLQNASMSVIGERLRSRIRALCRPDSVPSEQEVMA